MTRAPGPSPQRSGIYRFIQALMVVDMVAGAGLVVAGLVVGPQPDLVLLGAALGIVGGAMFLFFRALARRAAADGRPPRAP